MTFGSQSGAGTFSLSPTSGTLSQQARQRYVLTLVDNLSAKQLQLVVTGPANPGVAYFNGCREHHLERPLQPTKVNWSSDSAGTKDAGNIPGFNTDVFLTAGNQTSSASRPPWAPRGPTRPSTA